MDLLDMYRKEIDEIDKKMTSLFEERMNITKKVSKYKEINNMPIYQGDREEAVIAKNIALLENKEYSNLLRNYYKNLMYLSRLNQEIENHEEKNKVTYNKSLKVGYQGVIGSFSEEAMYTYFKDIEESKNYSSFEELFLALENEEINYIIAPIENSFTGAITKVYDLLNKHNFYIVGEECIKINQHLLGVKGSDVSDIKEVYSHPQGFEQSSNTLSKYKELNLIPYLNTATSAELVSRLCDKSKGAIASKRASEIYKLDIILENINDDKDNSTKFAVISKEKYIDNLANKTSIIVSIEDKSGSLVKTLEIFNKHNINLNKIESRPNKTIAWKYLFYIDFEGCIKDLNIEKAIMEIKKQSNDFKFLGSYKKYNK